MTHPTTLAEALEMVPEYLILRPRKNRWQEGDEDFNVRAWEIIPERRHNAEIAEHHNPGRRPVPQEVREAMKTMAEAVHKDGIVSLYDFREASMIVAQWLLSQGD